MNLHIRDHWQVKNPNSITHLALGTHDQIEAVTIAHRIPNEFYLNVFSEGTNRTALKISN